MPVSTIKPPIDNIKKRVDIMVDIETLGTNESVQIIQLSAKAFDITSGEVFESEFNEFVDLNSVKNLTIDGSTLKWWMKTDPNLLANILLNEKAVGIKTVLKRFVDFTKSFGCEKENIFLWGNGILFDNRIIQQAMTDNDMTYPIFFRNDRDVRTILELASLASNWTSKEIMEMVKQEGVKHNAIDDVLFQIRLVNICYKIIMK